MPRTNRALRRNPYWNDYKECHLSDAEMIELTGMSRQTVARWRDGRVPVPKWAYKLARWRYYGLLSEFHGKAWNGFFLGRDGLLYLPGFKYGFKPEELGQWWRLIHEKQTTAAKLAQAERDLAKRDAEIEELEKQVDFYRRQVRLEASMGMMLERLAA